MIKIPKQKRSKALVASILDATALTIVEIGFDETTTNHVAEKAGVSIGSFYQYFPNKEVLVNTLVKQKTEALMTQLQQLSDPQGFPIEKLEEVTPLMITFIFQMIRNDPLLLELIPHLDKVQSGGVVDQAEHYLLTLAQAFFVKNYSDYPIVDLQTKLYVLMNATMFTAVRFFNQKPLLISEAKVVKTLSDMIVNTLEHPSKL